MLNNNTILRKNEIESNFFAAQIMRITTLFLIAVYLLNYFDDSYYISEYIKIGKQIYKIYYWNMFNTGSSNSQCYIIISCGNYIFISIGYCWYVF